MAKFSDLMIDPELARDGAIFEWRAGIRLRVRPLHNPELVDFLRRNVGEAAAKSGKLEMDFESPIFREGVARYVLVGWDGVDAEDGSGPQAYSWELGLGYFNDSRLPHFFQEVVGLGAQTTNFRARSLEAVEKN